jgi:hypothetical protein
MQLLWPSLALGSRTDCDESYGSFRISVLAVLTLLSASVIILGGIVLCYSSHCNIFVDHVARHVLQFVWLGHLLKT